MRTIFKTVASLLAVGFLPICAQAQRKVIIEDDEPNSVMFISRDKAGDEIIKIMDDPQTRRFQDPKAPRFLLTDQKGKFALGIGGYVKLTSEYDFGGIVDNVDFYPALIPNKHSGDYARNQFQMDPTTSTIFLKLVGKTNRLGNFVVYTSGDFRGDGKTFRLTNAYASFLGFTAGYGWGSFMDLAAAPPTIDFAGPGGMAIYRSAQLRYEHSLPGNLKFGVGIEVPDVDGTTNQYTSIGTQRAPTIPAYLQYGWNSSSHVRAGAIVRSMTYSDLVSEQAKSKVGWGFQGSTTFTVAKNLTVYGQMTYGRGIGSYMNDLSNLNVDLVPDPDEEGKMQVLPMLGWYAGLQYNFTPNLFISSSYSQSRLYSEKGYPSDEPDMFRTGRYFVANIFYNVTKNMQVGAEYLRGYRKDFGGESNHANRVNVSVQYNF